MSMKALRRLLLLGLVPLSGCHTVLMSPSGDLALQQRDLIISSLILMLLIVVPVIIMALVFAWRYRASNKKARHDPDWDHSTMLELLIWSAPLLIIIALGALTWVSTHKLDPYRPLDRIAAGKPIPADVKPLEVDVVALDWKWLFIYPEQNMAVVNELAAPVDRPIQFRITASTVMNSFFIPALAGQIYAMPGMETQLQAVINKPGQFDGFSANFSGDGFSHMNFIFHGLSESDFAQWVQKVKAGSGELSRDEYVKLAQNSENVPVHYYDGVAPGLFMAIMGNCVPAGSVCVDNKSAAPSGEEGAMGSGHDSSGMAAMPTAQTQ
ncbi:ubiquinol oxidase subunit II [Dyella caseinilytica]|nr:ubiquinol oxidase subunit II [Dyella caseinilytica]